MQHVFDEQWAVELGRRIGIRPAAREIGIPPSTLQGMMRRAAVLGELGGPRIPEAAKPPPGFVVRRNSGQYDADGKLQRQWIESGQGNAEGYEVPSGHVVAGESALLDANGNVLAKWIKTRQGGGEGLVEALREAFAEYDGKAPKIEEPTDRDDDLLTVYPLPDLHLGLRAWKPETGTDYDLKIALRVTEGAFASLVSQSRPSKHAVVLGLGDYLHSNDHKEETPGSGHKLDVDGRWPKVYSEAAKLATRIIDTVARKHESVEVIFLQGNHDTDAAVTLSVALSLFYSSNERITVTENANIAWYRRFGSVLMGATHGHTVRKPEDMAMMLASDRAEDWGQSKHRHFFCGHIHHASAKEVAGVLVESFQSPSARDAWNSASGYRSGRSLSAITFHSQGGEIGRHRINIGSHFSV